MKIIYESGDKVSVFIINHPPGDGSRKAGCRELQEADPAAQGYSGPAEERQVLPETQELAVVEALHESKAALTSE